MTEVSEVLLAGGPTTGVDVISAARQIVSGLLTQPWGQVSPSVYETGRLVTLAPWLTGHSRRIDFLLATQRPDGGWGGPGGYALVPTLSATEALLTTVRRDRAEPGHVVDPASVVRAVDRGLHILSARALPMSGTLLPDMPAIEIIVCALVDELNTHLASFADAVPPGLEAWRGGRLPVPPGVDRTPLDTLRAGLAAGAGVPEKLLHCLEAFGDLARGAPTVQPVSPGTVGASPAATAAWLGERPPADPDEPAVRHLAVVARGGPVPCGIPLTTFERAWVLSGLSRAGIQLDVPEQLVASLRASLGPTGTPGGPGLPPDADTTAVTLFALAQFGRPPDADCLWGYETATHFCTWPGESYPSTSVNAHVLEAIGSCLPGRSAAPRYRAAVAKVAAWLRRQQRPDGGWRDRWHASGYYATACCALALSRFGGKESRDAVRRARRWILATQRPDGSWGRWYGTAEETAYAMQVLRLTAAPDAPPKRTAPAVAQGYRYLVQRLNALGDPPLWHDKDLYQPPAIVRAAVLAAVHVAQRDTGTGRRLPLRSGVVDRLSE